MIRNLSLAIETKRRQETTTFMDRAIRAYNKTKESDHLLSMYTP